MKNKKQFIIALVCIVVLSGVFLGISYLGDNLQVFNNTNKNKVENTNKESENAKNDSQDKTDSSVTSNTEDKAKENDKTAATETEKDKAQENVKEGYYIVKKDDTLYSIARTYMPSHNVSEVVKQIIKRNNMKVDEAIVEGQKLIISYETSIEKKTEDKTTSTGEHSNHIQYIVKAGDTLYSIAQEYFKDMDTVEAITTIKAHNNIENDIIKVDETLCIPVK